MMVKKVVKYLKNEWIMDFSQAVKLFSGFCANFFLHFYSSFLNIPGWGGGVFIYFLYGQTMLARVINLALTESFTV